MSIDLTTLPRVLDTARLTLRPPVIADAKGLFAILSDTETMRYWSGPPIEDISEAIKVLEGDLASDARGTSLCWSAILKEEDRMIGKFVMFNFNLAHCRAEFGYILNREYWRRGLAQEALEAMISFSFNTLGLHRIEADVVPENTGSLGILEKLGFIREGLFRDRWYLYDKWVDSVMLGLINPVTTRDDQQD